MSSIEIFTLIRADSPEEAYRKAIELGAADEASWENINGKRVTFRFRGLCDLNAIQDELEHGAELSYQEDIAVDESTIQEWIASKEDLRCVPARHTVGWTALCFARCYRRDVRTIPASPP